MHSTTNSEAANKLIIRLAIISYSSMQVLSKNESQLQFGIKVVGENRKFFFQTSYAYTLGPCGYTRTQPDPPGTGRVG